MQCNGQCYLAKQMRQIENEYEQSKRPFHPKHSEVIDFLLFCEKPSANFQLTTDEMTSTIHGGRYEHFPCKGYTGSCFHPPARFFDATQPA